MNSPISRATFISLLTTTTVVETGRGLAQSLPIRANLDSTIICATSKTTSIRSGLKGFPVVEPHVSAHPSNNDHLLIAAMVVTDIENAYESSRLSSFVSLDGGQSWTETAHDWWGYDPWTAILRDGTTVMTWIGTPGEFQGQYPIRFFSSPDGGLTWSDQIQTLPGGHDGTKVVGFEEEFYFTTVHFRGHGADVVLYHNDGAGLFEEMARIPNEGRRLNFCEPAMLTDGTVIVPVAHGGSAWVHAYDPLTEELSAADSVTQNSGGARGYLHLTADTNEESAFTDRLYFVRAVGGAAGRGIWLNQSQDRGLTWHPDRRIDLFAGARPSEALVPSATVNRQGVLGVSWVDRHNTGNGNDVYFTASCDGGQSFSEPVRVTRVSSDPRTEGNGDVANKFPGGGHYLGIAARLDGSFQLVWSDSRSGRFELQTSQVKVKRLAKQAATD